MQGSKVYINYHVEDLGKLIFERKSWSISTTSSIGFNIIMSFISGNDVDFHSRISGKMNPCQIFADSKKKRAIQI